MSLASVTKQQKFLDSNLNVGRFGFYGNLTDFIAFQEFNRLVHFLSISNIHLAIPRFVCKVLFKYFFLWRKSLGKF